MSRCIPFPPPGYLWNGVGGEALVELLKLRRERAEAKKDKKKEKRRRKTENKHKTDEKIKKKHSHQRKQKQDRSKNAEENSDCQKKREHENHGIDHSSLTEDLEQPIIPGRVDTNILYPFVTVGRSTQIDFQLHNDQEPIASAVCTTPSRTNLDVLEKYGLAPRLGKEQLRATSGMATVVSRKIDFKDGIALGSSPPAEIEFAAANGFETSSKSSFLMELKFRKLIVNWEPLSLQTEHSEFDDQEWLFERRLSRSPTGQNMTAKEDSSQKMAANEELCRGSYPHARYLPDADIYALPFTVPF
ncbi:glutamic acid-rich protein-like isoform X1 [Quillaja saponaria]|uniref:Glutamic acid-rich protein-like isoform X1 n=1 Tax=Quillaja saponaria TaxID=32244 RepID=A0AAD7LZZ0_QUISA|nr:glutamic acid-rich protein-like isoform X1 [Quillaja saponaria]